uniref:Uncharacterized protein n=1 Tax=Arundo donax TaxID=35708 RepID=A0A0A9BNS5_ARUDO
MFLSWRTLVGVYDMFLLILLYLTNQSLY